MNKITQLLRRLKAHKQHYILDINITFGYSKGTVVSLVICPLITIITV